MSKLAKGCRTHRLVPKGTIDESYNGDSLWIGQKKFTIIAVYEWAKIREKLDTKNNRFAWVIFSQANNSSGCLLVPHHAQIKKTWSSANGKDWWDINNVDDHFKYESLENIKENYPAVYEFLITEHPDFALV